MVKRRVAVVEQRSVDASGLGQWSATLAVAFALCAGCNGSTGGDAGDAGDAGADSDVILMILDGGGDAGDGGMDVPLDVPPASLPGRWRLVGWTSMGINGETTLTDVDPTAGAQSSRVNGTLTLSGTRMSVTVGWLDQGHFGVDPAQATGALAVAATHTVTNGTLGATTFSASGMPDVVFGTQADGTITYRGTFGNLGPAQTTWEPAGGIPALSVVRGQGYVVKLQPATAAAMVAPRAVIAWDRPGAGYSYTNDAPLHFISSGIAAINLDVAAAPSDAVGTIGDTTISVGYLVVYDDANGNGMYDPPSTAMGDGGSGLDATSGGDAIVDPPDGAIVGDGAVMGAADVLRGVSPIVIALRAGPGASPAWAASPFVDLLPGTQLTVLAPDTTVAGVRMSLGLFDTTHPVTPDTIVEPLALTSLPDLIP